MDAEERLTLAYCVLAILALDEDTPAAELIEGFQHLIDTGTIWQMEGTLGRVAINLIEEGDCYLGEEAHLDAYGNRVPSRFEIAPGAPGSVEFVEECRAKREAKA